MGCDLIEAALNNVGPQDTCEQFKGRYVSRDTERHANDHGFEMVRAAFHGDSGNPGARRACAVPALAHPSKMPPAARREPRSWGRGATPSGAASAQPWRF